MSSPRPPRRRRAPRQRLLLTFSSLAVVALLATAGGLTYVYSKYSRLPRVQLASVLAETAQGEGPRNFLLVGVDSAAELDADDPARAGRDEVGGLRSDTMMVLRLDPATDEAALLSFPRDLWVPLASGGSRRLNTAIQTGGPAELIDTIEANFGIPIHHYVQVDFAGFQDLVDVVDGVDVYFPTPARDTRSGLDIAEPGCITLDGEAALEYVRARHLESYEDGRWRTDPSADLGRISRQQDFIIRALERAVERGVRNPVTLDRLVDAGLETVTVDDLLRADEIVALGRALRSFDPGELELNTLPVRSGVVGGASILYLEEDEAQPILDRFRGTDAAAPQPVAVRVQVLNGSGVAGQALQTLDALAAAGFSTAGAGEADRFDFTEPVVRYVEGGQAKAELVARYLDPAPQLELVAGPLEAEVVVVTGALSARVLPTPRPPSTATTQRTSPTTTTTQADDGSSTTTTTAGFVPTVPPGVDC